MVVGGLGSLCVGRGVEASEAVMGGDGVVGGGGGGYGQSARCYFFVS